MKRFLIAAASVLLIATSFVGCYDPLSDPNATNPSASTAETEPVTEAKKAEDYKDTLAGLRDFMKDSGYITIAEKNANVTKMKAELIGAEKGYRYTTGNIKVELYAYKLNGKNPTRDEFIESVKKNGSFTLYNKEIKAYLSDSGKYLMVYSNPDIAADDTSSDAYKTMQKAIKAFKEF
ncbi:MAG: hypothetical protein J1E41_03085 [Ruminococcus sp.]|nr:hypothetical protein [Ruminococcus sp.]